MNFEHKINLQNSWCKRFRNLLSGVQAVQNLLPCQIGCCLGSLSKYSAKRKFQLCEQEDCCSPTLWSPGSWSWTLTGGTWSSCIWSSRGNLPKYCFTFVRGPACKYFETLARAEPGGVACGEAPSGERWPPACLIFASLFFFFFGGGRVGLSATAETIRFDLPGHHVGPGKSWTNTLRQHNNDWYGNTFHFTIYMACKKDISESALKHYSPTMLFWNPNRESRCEDQKKKTELHP